MPTSSRCGHLLLPQGGCDIEIELARPAEVRGNRPPKRHRFGDNGVVSMSLTTIGGRANLHKEES
jgi:hypothetical protein